MNIKDLIFFYKKVWKQVYGFEPIINYGMVGKLFKPVFENFSPEQIRAMIVLHFNWRGANGDSDFVYKRLQERCFPIEWIPKAVNEYMAFLINARGLTKPEEFEKFVREFVD